MRTQMQKQQIGGRIHGMRIVITVITMLVVLVGIVFAIWHSQEHWAHISVPIIVAAFFALLGIAFLLMQICYPLSYVPSSARIFTHRKSTSPSSRSARLPVPRESYSLNERISPLNQWLPSTNPHIQKRQKAVDGFYASLIKGDVTAIVLTGMACIGKSTFAALVSKHIEEQRLATREPFNAEALWIKIDNDDTMMILAQRLFAGLKRPLPNLENLAPKELAKALFGALNSTHMARLVVIDQFDKLFDPQSGQIRVGESGLYEWIDLLNRQWSASRVLFIGRFWPQLAFKASTTHVHEYRLRGMEINEGVELLQLLQVKGKEEELRLIVEHCEGHPFALKFLATFLCDYHLSLHTFMQDSFLPKRWLEEAAQKILDPLFKNQFSQAQQQLLRAFSIYREPMPLKAAEALLDFNQELFTAQLLPALEILLAQSLILEAGKSRYELATNAYRLHSLVTHYFQKHFEELRKQASESSLQIMHAKAAQYYLDRMPGSSHPGEQTHNIRDIQPLLEAFWQLSQAESFEQAYALMEREQISSNLRRLWETRALLDLYQMLLPLENWNPTTQQELAIYNNLGKVYSELGRKREAKKYLEQALRIASEMQDKVSILNDLGGICCALGEKEEARRHLNHALKISREIEDRKGESSVLANQGLLDDELGKKEEALKHLEQALHISQSLGDRWEEGTILSNLGFVRVAQGKKDEGLSNYKQALDICREIGNRRAEAATLRNFGQLYDELGEKEEALKHLEQALQLSRDLEDRWEEGKILSYIGHVHTDLEQYQEALNYYGQVLSILGQLGNHWDEGRTLSYLGHIYTHLGKHKEALDFYEQALRILEQVGDRWGETRVLNNLGRLYSEFGQWSEANKCFERALSVINEIRYQKREGGISHHSHRHKNDHRLTKQHLERAIDISRERKDRVVEGLALHNLAHVKYEMGHKKDAYNLYLHALRIHREVGDRRKVGSTLNHIGELYLDQRHYEAALFSLLLAQMILEEVESPDHKIALEAIENLQKEVGKQRFDELSDQVRTRVEQAKSNEDRIPELVQSVENVRDFL